MLNSKCVLKSLMVLSLLVSSFSYAEMTQEQINQLATLSAKQAASEADQKTELNKKLLAEVVSLENQINLKSITRDHDANMRTVTLAVTAAGSLLITGLSLYKPTGSEVGNREMGKVFNIIYASLGTVTAAGTAAVYDHAVKVDAKDLAQLKLELAPLKQSLLNSIK